MAEILLESFPVKLTLEHVLDKLSVTDDEGVGLATELYNEAMSRANPKIYFRDLHVDRIEGGEAVINGVSFKSKVLADNLEGVEVVIAYVMTCGVEVDEWSHTRTDSIEAFWLDIIKEQILYAASVHFHQVLRDTYGLDKTSSVSPGSGNVDAWPIAQQRDFFRMMGSVREKTGVVLTDSYLMLPTKSVSGVIFQSDRQFVNCILCSRENCQNRRAQYKPV